MAVHTFIVKEFVIFILSDVWKPETFHLSKLLRNEKNGRGVIVETGELIQMRNCRQSVFVNFHLRTFETRHRDIMRQYAYDEVRYAFYMVLENCTLMHQVQEYSA